MSSVRMGLLTGISGEPRDGGGDRGGAVRCRQAPAVVSEKPARPFLEQGEDRQFEVGRAVAGERYGGALLLGVCRPCGLVVEWGVVDGKKDRGQGQQYALGEVFLAGAPPRPPAGT